MRLCAHIYISLRINAHISTVCIHAYLYICTHADVLELERALPAAAAGARAAASGAGSAARAREFNQIGGSVPASYKPPRLSQKAARAPAEHAALRTGASRTPKQKSA